MRGFGHPAFTTEFPPPRTNPVSDTLIELMLRPQGSSFGDLAFDNLAGKLMYGEGSLIRLRISSQDLEIGSVKRPAAVDGGEHAQRGIHQLVGMH